MPKTRTGRGRGPASSVHITDFRRDGGEGGRERERREGVGIEGRRVEVCGGRGQNNLVSNFKI